MRNIYSPDLVSSTDVSLLDNHSTRCFTINILFLKKIQICSVNFFFFGKMYSIKITNDVLLIKKIIFIKKGS